MHGDRRSGVKWEISAYNTVGADGQSRYNLDMKLVSKRELQTRFGKISAKKQLKEDENVINTMS